jgi:hypothetical protein
VPGECGVRDKLGVFEGMSCFGETNGGLMGVLSPGTFHSGDPIPGAPSPLGKGVRALMKGKGNYKRRVAPLLDAPL